MKRAFLLVLIIIATVTAGRSQSSCPGNLLINSQFSSGLTGWTQYGSVTNATVLNGHVACLDTFLSLQATTNSNCGVEQPLTLTRDSCYSICYCVEFPGNAFNSKLTLAAITPGVTVSQLLSGSFTPLQAQIIDVLYSTSTIPPNMRCTGRFKASGAFTSFVIVNQTIGPIGSDIRIDNICFIPDSCVASCASVLANFAFSVGVGNSVTFTDISTSNPGDVLSWTWDFGDPPSGPANTSTLQNPVHVYPGPGTYTVCLYLMDITTVGIVCFDTICININISTVGFPETLSEAFSITPNPAGDYIVISGPLVVDKLMLYSSVGHLVWQTAITGAPLVLPAYLPNGFYEAVLSTKKGNVFKKLLIFR
jgi:PKD repeat protein